MPEVVQRPVKARNAFAVSWSCDLMVSSYCCANKTCHLHFAVEEVMSDIETSVRICQGIGLSFNYLAGQCLIQDHSDF